VARAQVVGQLHVGGERPFEQPGGGSVALLEWFGAERGEHARLGRGIRKVLAGQNVGQAWQLLLAL
jgi:hypothetical protein